MYRNIFSHFVHLVLVSFIRQKQNKKSSQSPLFPFFTPETIYFPYETPMLIDYSLLIVNNRSVLYRYR